MHLAALTGRGAPDTLGRLRKRAAGVHQDHPASRPRTTTPGPSVDSGHTERCNYIHHARHRLFPAGSRQDPASTDPRRSHQPGRTRGPGSDRRRRHRGYTCDPGAAGSAAHARRADRRADRPDHRTAALPRRRARVHQPAARGHRSSGHPASHLGLCGRLGIPVPAPAVSWLHSVDTTAGTAERWSSSSSSLPVARRDVPEYRRCSCRRDPAISTAYVCLARWVGPRCRLIPCVIVPKRPRGRRFRTHSNSCGRIMILTSTVGVPTRHTPTGGNGTRV